MLIAQITDVHLGFEPDNPAELNRRRLDCVIGALSAMTPAPDLLVVTGDLAESGAATSYRQLRRTLAALPFPSRFCVGNHDVKSTFLEAFPETPSFDGFVQYVDETWPLRLIILDTVQEGRHGGAFCERRAGWLEARLAEAPDRPTLLFLHHTPVPTGIDWMTVGPEEPWAARLTAVVSSHPQVVAAMSGHVHRPMVAPWAGATLIVCPSVAPQVSLDLLPMDLETTDNRPLVIADPPGFALHLWSGGRLVTHFGASETGPVLARYDESMNRAVRSFVAERADQS